MKIIISSNNAKKLKEIKAILGCEVVGYREFLEEIEVVEDGKSFEENAFLKANAIAEKLKLREDFLVIADDSGLCVEDLGGMPSIFSARFASLKGGAKEMVKGEFEVGKNHCSDELNNLKLLSCLNELGIQSSVAKFVCVIAVVGVIGGEKISKSFYGELEGKVGHHPLDNEAFGYDPLFVPKGFSQTLNHIQEKNSFSHRFMALHQFKKYLEGLA